MTNEEKVRYDKRDGSIIYRAKIGEETVDYTHPKSKKIKREKWRELRRRRKEGQPKAIQTKLTELGD